MLPWQAFLINGQDRNRTGDPAIFSRMLYQLSYLPAAHKIAFEAAFRQGKAEELPAIAPTLPNRYRQGVDVSRKTCKLVDVLSTKGA